MTQNLAAADAARPMLPAADTTPRLEKLFGFGGAKARYRNHPGRVIRCIDPFTGSIEAFKSPLKYENWLLRRFDPTVAYLNTSADEWSVLQIGTLLTIKPHLVWARLGERGTLETVVEPGRGQSHADVAAHRVVAEKHQMRAAFRTVEQVRESRPMLELLDRIRQTMALHYVDLREEPWTARIAEHVGATRRCTRQDVVTEFTGLFGACSPQLVDAALFWLRQYQHVFFDIEGGAYGNATVITC